ncbi:hypothetical protein CTAYLR_007829 [Chrysophaeum taylorii]|uniref:Ankyrin repeat domain-containing protein n=1 Tax=Chrysophaeum taylorii TaxID=2483200 RepID=A0AAD7UCA3_9STRA|nr:hypothetical protein CTAYLR_007829 [Chrysophaeum taylorii]
MKSASWIWLCSTLESWVLTFLESVAATVSVRCVCRRLARVIAGGSVCRGIAHRFALALPAGGRRRRTRLNDKPLRALGDAAHRQRAVEKAHNDREVWRLWLEFHEHDPAARVTRLVRASPSIAFHRLKFFEDRTLSMLAAWQGRRRSLQVLIDAGADPDAADARNFSPLLFAAWAGRARVVRYLLGIIPGVDLERQGEPPKTSSCGGRGSKTALEWAARKGYPHIIRALVAASRANKNLSPEPFPPPPKSN